MASYCAQHDLQLGDRLAGGQVSAVYEAAARGRRIVVKCDPSSTVHADASWLSRHRSAPQVLDVDESRNIMVLEHVDGTLLVDQLELADDDRCGHWLQAAAAATGPAAAGLVDVRVRYRRAFREICIRPNRRRVDVDAVERWFEWADAADTTSWGTVGLDVIAKNTIVDPQGCWWAIDPLCAWAPPELVYLPWVIDLIRKRFAATPDRILADQQRMFERFDVASAATWMPGAMLWTLSWCPADRPLHTHTLDALEHWLDVWATDTR